MPRTSRASQGGYVYHALNRGNGRNDVFHKPDDFAAFVGLMCEAHDHVPMRLTGYCLLNNHFHLLLWPYNDGDLSQVGWVATQHLPNVAKHDWAADPRTACFGDLALRMPGRDPAYV